MDCRKKHISYKTKNLYVSYFKNWRNHTLFLDQIQVLVLLKECLKIRALSQRKKTICIDQWLGRILGRIQAKRGPCWQVWFVPTVNSCWVWGTGAAQPQKKFQIYTLIYVWKQYFQLLKWHKTFTYIIIYKYFFLKNWQSNHKLIPPLLRNMLYWKTILISDYPSPEDKVTSKMPVLKLFRELGKFWKWTPGYSKIPIFHLFHELEKT